MQSLPVDYVPQQEWYLVHHGNGMNREDVERMPIYERLWWVRKLSTFIEEHNRRIEQEEQRARRGNGGV